MSRLEKVPTAKLHSDAMLTHSMVVERQKKRRQIMRERSHDSMTESKGVYVAAI